MSWQPAERSGDWRNEVLENELLVIEELPPRGLSPRSDDWQPDCCLAKSPAPAGLAPAEQ